MKKMLSLLFLISVFQAKAQFSLNGSVLDEKAASLPLATVTLLDPADSTLAYYAISDGDGRFEMKSINPGKYIFQAALLGYKVFYKNVEIPYEKNDIGTVVLKENAVTLTGTEVTAEHVPILIKKDTVEYNAGSYKTKPDASTEELLKKLPGVQVDREGNIKAQGEDVKKVLVDGKEFFSTDPKVATKNLPADAIDKVQVYDKKSDETEFTGIEDGSREKTINLLLKDNKKSAWMGDVQAGGGTDSHYETSAKAYRFTKKNQFAVLGMLNNINQFGFSFRDYIDFNGGIGAMMGGDGEMRLGGDDNSFPINFGQTVTGLITSGAGGLNYTYEKKKGNRFNISYLGNGADKFETNSIYTQNFSNTGTFISDEAQESNSMNLAHRLNLGFRNKPDSTQQIIFNANAGLTNSNGKSTKYRSTLLNNMPQNFFSGNNSSDNEALSGQGQFSYLKKGYGKWKLFKLAAEGSGNMDIKNKKWANSYSYPDTSLIFSESIFRNDRTEALKISGTISATRKLSAGWYLAPELKGGTGMDVLDREQGIPSTESQSVDSLSPFMLAQYHWARPALSIRRSNDKTQFNFSARAEFGQLQNTLNDSLTNTQQLAYFLPRISWNREYKKNHRLNLFYVSRLNQPTAGQLLPIEDNTDPLQSMSGNNKLRPEYMHDANVQWMIFDPFSFTSLFTGINATYTKDKINWERNIDSAFNQSLHLINVSDDYRASVNSEFSTPIRKLKINLNLEAREEWNRGINFVNEVKNINTNYTHELKLSIDNRKKEKWDVRAGMAARVTNSFYSLQTALNSNYFDLNYFADLDYSPNDKWHFTASADIMQYNAKSFRKSVSVPLIRAEVSRYFLKSKRGSLTLKAFDILNKNTGISRASELNYLEERRSNIIGRYAMLTFKYRLNKFDGNGGVNIKVNGR